MSNIVQLDKRPQLRRWLARVEGVGGLAPWQRAPLGLVPLDAALGGGLIRARLHELCVTGGEGGDGTSVAGATVGGGFASVLALRLGGPVVWLRTVGAEAEGGGLSPLGLLAMGMEPASLTLCTPPDPLALLRAASDVVRCPEVGVAVIELWRQPGVLTLTATRRLALAAEASGVTALLLQVAAEPRPSAAQTRWVVRPAASAALESGALEDGAPGHPAWDLELVRNRGLPVGGIWQVEWDRDRKLLQERRPAEDFSATPLHGPARTVPTQPAAQRAGASLPGAVVPLVDDGAAAAPGGDPRRRRA